MQQVVWVSRMKIYYRVYSAVSSAARSLIGGGSNLTNFASGFALTLREFLVGVGFAVRPGRPLRPFLFCSMQDALLDLVRPLA